MEDWRLGKIAGIAAPWVRRCDVTQMLFPDVPVKLVTAKMTTLIERKLVDGYPGNCRGDYEITELGIMELARLEGRVLEHRPHISHGTSPDLGTWK